MNTIFTNDFTGGAVEIARFLWQFVGFEMSFMSEKKICAYVFRPPAATYQSSPSGTNQFFVGNWPIASWCVHHPRHANNPGHATVQIGKHSCELHPQHLQYRKDIHGFWQNLLVRVQYVICILTPGVSPVMFYMGRLRPKGEPLSDFRFMKGRGFH